MDVESSTEDDNTEFKVGEMIEAQWKDDSLFYSAKITRVKQSKKGETTYDVEFIQDGIIANGLKRDQVQGYRSDDDEEPARHRIAEDEEYVDSGMPLLPEDQSVESASDEREPRKRAGRKPANKRKREVVHAPSNEKKKKLNHAVDGLTEDQLVQVIKQACAQNSKILDAVHSEIVAIEEEAEAAEASAKRGKGKKAREPEPPKPKKKEPVKKAGVGKAKAAPKKAAPPKKTAPAKKGGKK